MSYSVEHVRFTLKCDACGATEKRDLDDVAQRKDFERDGMAGWSEIRTNWRSFFCCPTCCAAVGAVLQVREREEQQANAATEASCEHDYQHRGLLMKCTKCGKWR